MLLTRFLRLPIILKLLIPCILVLALVLPLVATFSHAHVVHASGGVTFDNSPGSAAPPPTLGPYSMTPFPADTQPTSTMVSSVKGPPGTGTIGFAPDLEHVMVNKGWNTWSNGYTGDVYATLSVTSMTFTLPSGTSAFYFYAEPDPYATFDVTATTQNGTTSGPIPVNGFFGASYFGFYTDGSTALASITVSSSVDFAVGEFGISTSSSPLPPPGPRPIIFIPGITGSFLRDATGSETWPIVQQLADCLHWVNTIPGCDGAHLAPNILDPNGTTIPGDPGRDVDAANGIQRPLDYTSTPAGGAIDFTNPVHDGFHAPQHVYDVTVENLKNSGYPEVNPNDDPALLTCSHTERCFIPVGVDWRKSAAFNAARILSVIDHVVALTGTDRVDILAHSQGGLIVNALVHMPSAAGKIYRVVTLGTPWLGAPKLLAALLYAEPCLAPLILGGCALDPDAAQQLIKDYPGAAELNPSCAYFAATVYSPLIDGVVNGAPISMTCAQAQAFEAQRITADPLNRDTSLLKQAEAFHDSVDSWAPVDPSVQLARMIGYDAAESDQACVSAPCDQAGSGHYVPSGKSTISAIDAHTGSLYYDDGDGTVPLNSANVYDPATSFDDRNGASDQYFCAVSHQGLAQNTTVWEFAQFFLEGETTYTHDAVRLGCPDTTDGTLQGVDLGATSSASVSIQQGRLFTVSGSGFAPLSSVSLTLHSDPVALGKITTDSTGAITAAVIGMPPTASPGLHTITADGFAPGGAPKTVTTDVMVVPHSSGIGGPGSISGTTLDASTASPLASVCVQAIDDRTGAVAGQAQSDSHGHYEISQLPAGTYRAAFRACAQDTVPQTWYRDALEPASAHLVSVAAGGERVGIDGAVNVCTRTITSTIQGPLLVTSGTTCAIAATIQGGVNVAPGASLVMLHAVVHGMTTTQSAGTLIACGTTFDGSVSVAGNAGQILFGDGDAPDCQGNVLNGSMSVQLSTNSVQIGGNSLAGSLLVNGSQNVGMANRVGTEIEGNRIHGSLSCSSDAPAPTNDNLPNTVTGLEGGQCAHL